MDPWLPRAWTFAFEYEQFVNRSPCELGRPLTAATPRRVTAAA